MSQNTECGERQPRSLTPQGKIRFSTRRDFEAAQELIRRSDLGYKEPGVVTLEPIVNADATDPITCEHCWQDDAFEWHSCDAPADVRIVRNRGYEYDENSSRPTRPRASTATRSVSTASGRRFAGGPTSRSTGSPTASTPSERGVTRLIRPVEVRSRCPVLTVPRGCGTTAS